MAYTVHYTQPGMMKRKTVPISNKKGKRLITICAVIVMILSSVFVLSDARVQNLLIPGKPEVTKAAFAQMTQNVRNGQSVDDAIVAFCRQIIACEGA